MNRTKKSLLIAFTATLNNLLNSVVGLLLTSLIIRTYGSDFNGLTSTSSQLINMLMIVEGGFTTAINVALFAPYVKNDTDGIAAIWMAAKNKFYKIGILFIVLGIAAAAVYTFFVKTNFSYFYALAVFIMSLIPTFLNIFIALKWKVLFQMEQKDYIVNAVTSVSTILTLAINVFIVLNNGWALLTRIVIMTFSIANTIVVCRLGNLRYKKYKKTNDTVPVPIKGVNDVFILNLTGVVYSSAPILYITAAVGTKMASVYAVYNGIFLIIKSIVNAIVRSPVIGIGQVIHEDIGKARKIFSGYQFAAFFLITYFLSVTSSLAIPFVSLLTKGNQDIEYQNILILLLLSVTFFVENIHIPSGQMIIMSGEYKVCRQIQTIALFIIFILGLAGNQFIGIYGILLAVFVSAVYLCVREVKYNYKYILKESYVSFFKLLSTSFAVMAVNIIINQFAIIKFDTYTMFIVNGIWIGLIDFFVSLFIFTLCFKILVLDIYKRIKALLSRKFRGNKKEI